MLWRALAAFGVSAMNGGGGAPGRDLRSVPNIHWGGMLSNMGDPLNFMGGSGSNVGANMTNPAGFGAIHGDVPNNNVDPSAQPGYGQSPSSSPGGISGNSSMMTGISPYQQMQLFQAYQNFMKNLGIPGSGPARPVITGPNYGAMQGISAVPPMTGGGGMGSGAGPRGPRPLPV